MTALDVELEAATLEDAFLALTGQKVQQGSGEQRPAPGPVPGAAR